MAGCLHMKATLKAPKKRAHLLSVLSAISNFANDCRLRQRSSVDGIALLLSQEHGPQNWGPVLLLRGDYKVFSFPRVSMFVSSNL